PPPSTLFPYTTLFRSMTREGKIRVPVEAFPAMLGPDMTRVEGTAVYLSPDSGSVPPVLLHNLKHNKVLHERVIFLTVVDAEVPRDRKSTRLNSSHVAI